MSDIPCVTIGNAVLYNGDCVAVTELIKDRIDHTIMDPPYEAAAHVATRRVSSKLKVSKIDFESMDEDTRQRISALVVQKTAHWVLIFCQADSGHEWKTTMTSRYRSTMVWVKPDSKPNFTGRAPGIGYESIVLAWCGEGFSHWNGGGRAGVFTYNIANTEKDEFNIHTTVKPHKLMCELVGLFSDKGETIFDPFMGSGSTGVAAVSMGRKFIGIERDPKYFDICCKRIEAAQREGLINAPYVKTRAKLAAPLLYVTRGTQAPKTPQDPAPAPAKAPRATKAAKAAPAPRFAAPTILATPKAKELPPELQPPPLPPLPFAQQAAQLGGAKPTFDEDEWDAKPKTRPEIDDDIPF